jgi:hypothetical protein
MGSARRKLGGGNTTVRFQRIVADLATIYSIHIRALIGEIQKYINNALYYNIQLLQLKHYNADISPPFLVGHP